VDCEERHEEKRKGDEISKKKKANEERIHSIQDINL